MPVLNWWILNAEYALPDTHVHTYVSYAYSHTGVCMCILLPQPCKITAKFHSEVMLYRNQGCTLMLFIHVGLRQWDTKQFVHSWWRPTWPKHPAVSCYWLNLLCTYVRIWSKINLLVIKHCWEWSVLLKQLPSMCLVIYVYACVLSRRHSEIK